MKQALAVLNLYGDALHRTARESMQHAAERWDVDFLVLTQPVFRWRDPYLEKMALDIHCFDYHRVVYVDRDVVIRSDCPNLLDLVAPTHVGGVPSEQEGHHFIADIRAHMDPLCRTLGITLDYQHEYFNSGVLVFGPKRHAHVFETARRMIPVCADRHWVVYDQGMLSAAIACTQTPLYTLDATFNRCGAVCWDQWQPEMREYIRHYCGTGNNGSAIGESAWR